MLYFFSILTLTTLIQTKKPFSKSQQAIWRVECKLGVITDPDCPVDGGWAPWAPWTPCRGLCDNIGHHQRTRICNNPSPSKDGMPCDGLDEQIEPCYLTNCTLQDYRKLVEGDSARMEAFHQLEAVPALMERCLQMECPFEAIETALIIDNTWQLNPEGLWNALQCVKFNMGCPVVGEWGSWGAWSGCGARCGQGLRWRLRRCDAPPPSESHLICSGTPLQAEKCEGDQCAINTRDSRYNMDGSWGNWGKWSKCSENCGTGVRRRRRTCIENHLSQTSSIWGTHCRGQHDQLELCVKKVCNIDGSWSGWGVWGPCSQTCGAGRRSRTRTCTRPTPEGNGAICIGPKTEISSCHLSPCEVYSHVIAVLNGESSFQYNFENKYSVLFHFYVRFMPLSPHGTLVRRGTVRNPQVRLSLQKWHVCLDAGGLSRSCVLPRICSPTVIEPAVWHTALITVTSDAATLRLDDAQTLIRATFPCDPELPDDKMNIWIGERFHGELQELILNFNPLNIFIEGDYNSRRSDFCPSSASNIAYEKARMEEAYLILDNGQYLRLPCFDTQDEWRMELTLKPYREAGTILFLRDDKSDSWLHMTIQNMRLNMKLALGEFRSESISSTECEINQWLDVVLSRKRETNTVEASINAGERLHVVPEEITRKRRGSKMIFSNYKFKKSNLTEKQRNNTYDDRLSAYFVEISREPVSLTICNDEIFVGGIPIDIKEQIQEEFTPFSGVIASISINNVLQDLHKFSVERYKEDKVQVSSRTASVSGSYHETAWGKSNLLTLICLHARTVQPPHAAHWLFLDTEISGILKDKKVRSVDDGRILKLVASADNDLRGFYTCRAHASKRTRNIVTYGVLGKIQYKLTGPDTTTAIAVLTTVTLIVCTLTWLIIECINDLHTGFGFFRDCHHTPKEEADAVCKYIDQNMNLIGSNSMARMAKARARRKARRLVRRASFGAQEPQGMLEVTREQVELSEESSLSEPESLPALPAIKGSIEDTSHDLLKCEPNYISSPQHGSNITSSKANLTSSTSVDVTSPRVLCSRLLLNKRLYSSRESLVSRRSKISRTGNVWSPRKTRSKLLTIKSSTYVNQSPAQKILQRFHELKHDDS